MWAGKGASTSNSISELRQSENQVEAGFIPPATSSAQVRWSLLAGLAALGLAVAAQSLLARRILALEPWLLFFFGILFLVWAYPPSPQRLSGRPIPAWVIGTGIMLCLGSVAGFFLAEMDFFPKQYFYSGVVTGAALIALGWLAVEWRGTLASARSGLAACFACATRGWRGLPSWLMLAGLIAGSCAAAIWVRDSWNQDPAMNDGLYLWLGGVVLFSAGAWLSHSEPAPDAPAFRLDRWDWLAIATIAAIAALFRAYQLSDVPYGSWYDEAESGLEAVEILKGKPFSPAGLLTPFNPALFFYMIAASFQVFGVGMLPIRFVTAAMGILAPATLYLLARLLFGRRTALLAAALLAVSAWHVNFSRFGLPNIISTPLEPLAFFLLLRGYQTRRMPFFVLAGLTLGIGMYSHTAFRLVLAIAGLLVVYWAASNRSFLSQYFSHLLVLAITTGMVLLPLAMYAVQHNEQINRRLSQTWIFVGKNTQEAKVEALRNGLTKHALMFNYQGDPNGRHGRPGTPVTDFAVGSMMVLGLGYSIYYWRRWAYFLLFAWFFLGLAAGALTIDWEAPQAARTVIMIPAVYLLAAIPLGLIWQSIDRLLPAAGRAVPALAVAGLLVWSGQTNWDLYFNQQMKLNEVWVAFSGSETSQARLLNELGPGYRFYFGAPDAPIVRLITDRSKRPGDFRFFNSFDHLPLKERVDKDVVFLAEPWRVPVSLSEFLRYYPGAETGDRRDLNGEVLFFYVKVKKDDILRIQGLNATYTVEGQAPMSRTDPNINFNWEQASPAEGRPFRVEWTGTLFVPTAGPYTLSFQSAGGGSVDLGEKRVLMAGEPGIAEARLVLPKGLHTFRVIENVPTGRGNTVLSWMLPNGHREPVPQVLLCTVPLPSHGLVARYYSGPNWQGDPKLVAVDQGIQFRWHPAPLDGQWSTEWRGQIEAPADGEYEINTRTNEQAWVVIDGKTIIDGARSNYLAKANMTKGRHEIVVRYKSTSGYSEMRLFWRPPGANALVSVPAEALFPTE